MARRKGPQAQQAYEFIKKRIQNFELAPGAPVSDHALEQELNMSRSPIREAIMRLSADGLVELTGTGAQVSGLTLKDIIEICQVRRALEVAAVEILMENGGLSEQRKEELTTCYRNLTTTTDIERNYYYDDLFHDMIVNMSGNQRLVAISNQMRAQMHRARWLNSVLPNRRAESDQEHEDIYRALIGNDAQASVEAIANHLDRSEENFRTVLSTGSALPARIMAIIPGIIGGQAQ